MLRTLRYVSIKNWAGSNLEVSNFIDKRFSLQADFIEKSQNNITNVLSLMIQKSNGLSAQSNDETEPKYTYKSSATILKEFVLLLNKLEYFFSTHCSKRRLHCSPL